MIQARHEYDGAQQCSGLSRDRVQVWALAGPLRDIQSPVAPPLLPGLRVVVLLEDEPWPRSEVQSRFSSGMSPYIAAFVFPLDPDRSPSTAMRHCRDGVGQVMSGGQVSSGRDACIQAKEFSLCFIRPEDLVSPGLGVLQERFLELLQVLGHLPPPPIAQFVRSRLQEESWWFQTSDGGLCAHWDPRSGPRCSPVSEVYGPVLGLHGSACALTCGVSGETFYRPACAVPDHVQSADSPQVDSV
ncbi:uncharacterized protein LOC122867437 [Siniperca chuatsi]|uniref:uncharacterized protein LOC122867437 n=1 Tax=Siniperca chuatsi TaxID=119488 RepID=UPI001CE142FE|nr:uncharacterized protein LOC122867437 [Siniperca chuatsi]